MNLTKKVRRSASRLCLVPEVLEDRVVLSAGQGSTFAIMPGSVTTPGQVSSLPFHDVRRCSPPKKNGNIVVGIDIAAATPRRPRPRRRRSSRRSSRSRMPSGKVDPGPTFEVRRQGRQGE